MLENIEMVKHIDGIGKLILTGTERPGIAAWSEKAAAKTAPLTWPHYPPLGLPEFVTVAAHDHYIVRKRKSLGDLVEHRAKKRGYLGELIPHLDVVNELIERPQAVSGDLSMDDVRVLPLLRSAAFMKGLRFLDKMRNYFESMMNRIGYEPLPAI
jgi:glutaredoxin 2